MCYATVVMIIDLFGVKRYRYNNQYFLNVIIIMYILFSVQLNQVITKIAACTYVFGITGAYVLMNLTTE